MPACEPVSEIARWPRSLIAIAHSAHEIRSPVESSMSISRGSGVVETSSAIAISSSVVLPRADSTATTRWPCSRGHDPARGALDALGVGDRGAAELHQRSGHRRGMGRRRRRCGLERPVSGPRRTPGAHLVPCEDRAAAAGARVADARPAAQRRPDLARRLPVERKVAQLFALGFRGTDVTADIFGRLRRQDLGGIVLAANNYVDSTQLGTLAAEAAPPPRGRHGAKPPWLLTIQEGAELNSFADLPPFALPADMGSVREAGARRTRRPPAAPARREGRPRPGRRRGSRAGQLPGRARVLG